MSKLTKNQKNAYAKVEPNKAYKLAEAAALLKEITFTKFDASVDIDVRLGVDPRKANQMVRGVVTLPHGTGKTVRVLVLCTPDKEEEAKARPVPITSVWTNTSRRSKAAGPTWMSSSPRRTSWARWVRWAAFWVPAA